MKQLFLSSVIICVLCVTGLNAQNIYYKRLNDSIVQQFADTSHTFSFKNKDSLKDYTSYFKYVLKFFPNMKYNSFKVIFKPSHHISKVKPTAFSCFKSPENRKYKIYFSNLSNSTLDSVLLKNLSTNSQIGLIATQMGHIDDLSTDGFFDILAWRFKQLSRRAKKKLASENEIRLLELGFGYQLLSLSRDVEEKMRIENWKNAKAYTNYVTSDRNKFISQSTISIFIRDMPVYATRKFK